MALTHSPSIVRDGLALHLDAANVKSNEGTIVNWLDISKNQNNGTMSNNAGLRNILLNTRSSVTGSAVRSTTTTISTVLPNGSMGNVRFNIPNADSGTHYVNSAAFTFVIGQRYTASWFLNPNGYNNFILHNFGNRNGIGIFTLTGAGTATVTGSPDGVNAEAFISKESNGWYRISWTWTHPSNGNNTFYLSTTPTTSFSFVGDGVSGVYICQNQFELSQRLTNYQEIGGNNTIVNETITPQSLIDFRNTNSFVSVPYTPDLDLVNEITLEAWINYTEATNTVCIEKSSNNSHYQFQIFSSGQGTGGVAGELVFMLQANSNNWVVAGESSNDGNWHHVVGTYNKFSTTAKLYIDGVLKNTNSNISVGPTSNSQPLLIGSRSGNSGFGGSVSVVKIYNKTLSATEIAQNFEATRGRFGV